MKKLATMLALGACSAFSLQVETSGYLNSDMYSEMFKNAASKTDHNLHSNLSFDLNTSVVMDEGFKLHVGLRATSLDAQGNPSPAPYGKGLIGDANSRWPQVHLNGVMAEWEFTENGSLVVGDLSYSGGVPQFYRFKDSYYYSSILSSNDLRGFGFKAGGLETYLGFSDANEKSMRLFGAFTLDLLDRPEQKATVRPFFDMILQGGGRDGRRFTWGIEGDFSSVFRSIDYNIHYAGGYLPLSPEGTTTLLVEPSLQWKNLTLNLSYFRAWPPADRQGNDISYYLAVPVEQWFYVEPGFDLNDHFALGLGFEWLEPDTKISGDDFMYTRATMYLYPNANSSIQVYAGYEAHKTGPTFFRTGLMTQVEF
jgi:hypothetical protein